MSRAILSTESASDMNMAGGDSSLHSQGGDSHETENRGQDIFWSGQGGEKRGVSGIVSEEKTIEERELGPSLD